MASAAEKQPNHRDTTILIRKDPSKPDGVRFQFEDGNGGTDRQTYENHGRPGFVIKFMIDDPDRTGLLFPKSKLDAMWAHPVKDANGPCPKPGTTWPEFEAFNVPAGGKTLMVKNRNSFEQLFKFSLNFTRDREDPDAPLVCWDPIGDNRNGGLRAPTPTAFMIGGVALAAGFAGAAAGYLACSQISRRD
jgi:hypothetical protein